MSDKNLFNLSDLRRIGGVALFHDSLYNVLHYPLAYRRTPTYVCLWCLYASSNHEWLNAQATQTSFPPATISYENPGM